MSLSTHLEQRLSDSPVWISEQAGPYLLSDFHDDEKALGLLKHTLAGRKVGLCFRSPILWAKFLLLLDGVCDQLLLLQAGSEVALLTKLCRDAVTDTVVADHEMDLDVPLINVLNNLPAAGEVDSSRDTVWIIPTSGTTGSPKLIPHTLKSLTRTVKPSRTNTVARWGLLYDVSRFAGLQVLFQSLLSGDTLLIPADLADTARTLTFLEQQGCIALSGTPTMWRKILMTPASKGLLLNQITLGGEIADQAVLNALRTRFPTARITHIYASTEAGVGFSVKDGMAGFPGAWLGHPEHDPVLKVREGFLWVRVSGRFETVRPPTSLELDNEGFINTGDLVEVTGERVRFLGRANGAINIGGNKVQPEEVETVLLAHPRVSMASVRGRANPFTGSIVVADVVAAGALEDKAAFCKELISHCRQQLAPYKVPALINLVADLSVNTTGKIRRN